MTPLLNVETNKSAKAFIDSIESDSMREDAKELVKIMKKITGKKPKVWGDNNFIAFGKYKYKRRGGKEEFEWFNVGFAPRKTNITLYLSCYLEKEEKLLKKLGKCKWGKGCLYIKRLSDLDLDVLKKLIEKTKDAQWG
jgi:hypothetical protein